MATKEQIMKELDEVIDPEIGQSIVKMDLIKNVKINGEQVSIVMTLTSPYCPLAGLIVEDVRQRIKNLEGVKEVNVDIVF